MKRTDSWLESRVTLHLPMADDGSDNVQTILVQALPFIEQAKANNKRILIHCRLGVNRSATIGKTRFQNKFVNQKSFYNSHKQQQTNN